MKNILTLALLLNILVSKAQCPAPSNVVYTTLPTQEVVLSWTENGIAISWDIAIIPDFNSNTPLPTTSWVTAASNPFTIVALPQNLGCMVFFVRSVCSNEVVSQWAAVATPGCTANVIDYLETLSHPQVPIINDNDVRIFPNPSKNVFRIASNATIDQLTLFDAVGKQIFIQTQNTSEINLESVSKGIYILEITSENNHIFRKLIKE
jgi:hypothetical protein